MITASTSEQIAACTSISPVSREPETTSVREICTRADATLFYSTLLYLPLDVLLVGDINMINSQV